MIDCGVGSSNWMIELDVDRERFSASVATLKAIVLSVLSIKTDCNHKNSHPRSPYSHQLTKYHDEQKRDFCGTQKKNIKYKWFVF